MNKLSRFLPLLLAALVAVGCTENGGAIFAIIEQEVATPDSDLPNTASVLDVLTLAGGTAFIAVSPALYLGTQSTAGENETLVWTLITGQPTGRTCLGAVLASATEIYAVFAAGETGALYQATIPADFEDSTAPVLEWTAVDLDFVDRTPQNLMMVNGEIFVVTRIDGVLPTYGLSHLDPAGPTLSDALDPLVLTSPVKDGAFHDGDYWFIAGASLLRGSTQTGPFADENETEAAIPDVVGFGGIHADGDSGRLHLSTDAGQVFVRDGAAWTDSAELTVPDSETKIIFTDFVSLAGGYVYVGTVGRGFYRLDTSGLLDQVADVDDNTARLPDYTIGELYGGTIQRMIATVDVVFVVTAGAGLWHQVVDTELAPKGWSWE